jgi:hypothetical protein
VDLRNENVEANMNQQGDKNNWTFGLPSGIGDVSWAYSKLVHLGPQAYQIADGWPHRTVPFMELLPGVIDLPPDPSGKINKDVHYGQFSFQDIVNFEHLQEIETTPKWADIAKKNLGVTLIQPNRHLEMGRRLEDWCPDLPTDFHYQIDISAEDSIKARNKLVGKPKPWTGISAASYRGSEAWKTWGYGEWSPFLKKYHQEVGGTIFLLGGFWDDLTDTLAADGWTSLVGKTSVGTVIETLRLLDYYIGFSSGLGVIRTVLKKNAFMLWPDFQAELSTSWAPPDMLENGTYVAQLWRPHELVFKRITTWLERIGD